VFLSVLLSALGGAQRLPRGCGQGSPAGARCIFCASRFKSFKFEFTNKKRDSILQETAHEELSLPKIWLRAFTPEWIYVLRKCLIDFRLGHGAFPNLLRPRSFSEKIQYRKLFDHRYALVQFADKFAVRDYVRQRLGDDVLPKLYHLTEDPDDIPLVRLPGRFVVKPTHGSGWIEVVHDKTLIDLDRLEARCAYWLHTNFFYTAGEWAYSRVTPRLMFEELLEDSEGGVPNDLKFFVFGGRVEFISVDIDRFGDHRRNMYDRAWNRLDFGFQRAGSDRPMPPPSRLEEMIRDAEILAGDFDFLRIDLYQCGERIVFGEITATPASGLEPFWPGGTDRWIGELWKMKR